MKAYLYLEDGTLVEGEAFGAIKETLSEIVFNTGMTGYQEILTDPSYREQTVVMTYPIVGNYGINKNDFESEDIQVKAFAVREYSVHPSHYECDETLDDFLKSKGIPGIYGIDTRMITKKIRNIGTMKCLLTYDKTSEAMEKINTYSFPKDVARRNALKEKMTFDGNGAKIGLLDLGFKRGILRELLSCGCKVILYPYNTGADEIMSDGLDGFMFSNGPGDPKDNPEIISLAKELFGKMPLFGICLGHQILALALGADTFKMKFGHRGSNHPVINLKSQKVLISSQNHGYEVDGRSLPEGTVKTYENINDGTLEGFDHPGLKIKAVQFHPEEGPGPVDGHEIIAGWINNVKDDEYNA
ncbi:carbamoyl phosphate synthase small subunit [Alkalibacter saccharofermentans]|uniref:Carbamoyl phosphate synthase small chain n=1 Tax=Alkalibacter saccharofermentans DSM 14828 TaxID=1120975 RepID=A0A1M4UC86_9FIRM|nr:carbamoyl phosphate synthase small subunit [Alkalibacter saccharofermentans]SHE54335.1 carbamoyl-phosphate synthase small subunit [Alkalibacter saccharofermentans DSM 14828]